MVTCRPDISTTTVCTTQHMSCQHPFLGRQTCNKILGGNTQRWHILLAPYAANGFTGPPNPYSMQLHGPVYASATRQDHPPLTTHAFVDSDWATCAKTRRSLRGLVVQLAGDAIAYKTKLQVTVALSSTEAEFMAATDAGKMILFIWSILWDLGIPQQAATILYEDNDACTAMANKQKSTSRTRHRDIRYFALSEWVERDLIILERIHTSINIADLCQKS
eukprot:CCRYP_007930-RA/>CCRYP_007930-RA protein AED:0.29 eAED:0.29 QI:0/0/0/1/0/0/2/0/219